MSGCRCWYPAKRLCELKPYPFASLDAARCQAESLGVDVIDMSVGDPDIEPPDRLLKELAHRLHDKGVHRYPPYFGTRVYREAAALWLKRRHGVYVDPERELTGVIGSKEGIAHTIFAMVGDGDLVLCPSPYFPMYEDCVRLAGGRFYTIPLTVENRFVLDLDSVSDDVWSRAKVLIVNYPHNPTSAIVDVGFWERLVIKARKFGFFIISDAAYIDIYDEDKPPSLLAVPGGKDVCVEFYSLSKTFSIPGWRLGFLAGNAAVVEALRKIKMSIDSGQFMALDLAAASLMASGDEEVDAIRNTYKGRRALLKTGLETAGFEVFSEPATLYVWSRVKDGCRSADFVERLLKERGVALMPGSAFGEEGEGYVRFSLTLAAERIKEACNRLQGL